MTTYVRCELMTLLGRGKGLLDIHAVPSENHPPIPSHGFTLTQFVAHQCQTCKLDTLRGYLSHVKDFSRTCGAWPSLPFSTRFTVQAALSGIKRHFGGE